MSDHKSLPAWREQSLGRRTFLRVSAASAATAALVVSGCADITPTTPTPANPNLLTLPAGNQGLFIYAYMLALAQAAVYQKVVDAPPSDLTVAERAIFADLRDHEVVHRQTIKYFLDPTLATTPFPADFAFNTAKFTLSTRAGVLAAAQELEDLTAAAYPVLLTLFTSAGVSQRDILLKMASVQYRHAATVRNLLAPGSFASSTAVDATGQLLTKTPTEVMAALAPYFMPYVISVTNLPVPV